ILPHLIDLRELHGVGPLVALAVEAFGRDVWVLVLRYALRDPGRQFKRKPFALSLIEGLRDTGGGEAAPLRLPLRVGLPEAGEARAGVGRGRGGARGDIHRPRRAGWAGASGRYHVWARGDMG